MTLERIVPLARRVYYLVDRIWHAGVVVLAAASCCDWLLIAGTHILVSISLVPVCYSDLSQFLHRDSPGTIGPHMTYCQPCLEPVTTNLLFACLF